MWVSLVLLILLLVIVVKQGSEGLFNALMTTMLAVCCAALAFGTYEWVATNWVASIWPEDSAKLPRDFILPIALAATFGVPLLILRLISDRLTRRPIPVAGWADRIGASLCGLVTALIMVGIVAACLQMMPFGSTFLGYARVSPAVPSDQRSAEDEPPDPTEQGKELLFGAPRFAPGLASVVSDGIFSGANSFYENHPDLMENIGWVGSVHGSVSRYAPPSSISIVRTEPVEAIYQMIPAEGQTDAAPTYRPIEPDAQHEFRMVRVQLKREAKDPNKMHAFSLRQFRLVGKEGADGPARQLAPIAIQQPDEDDPVNRHVQVTKYRGKFWPMDTEVFTPRSDNGDQVEIVFEVPKGFQPSFLEYKREARVAFSFDQAPVQQAPPQRRRRADASTPATPARPTPGQRDATADTGQPAPAAGEPTPPAPTPAGEQGASARRPRGSRAVTSEATGRPSQFSDEMPVQFRAYESRNAEINGEALVSGHLIGETEAQASGTQPPVTRFAVPEDKRLLQLSVARLQAGSTLGRAMARAIEVAQSYRVTDENGGQHPLVGKWAVATTRGRERVEVEYFPPPSGSMGGLGPFAYIQEQRLTPRDDFVLLFLVDPGVRIVSFSSGGRGGEEDLTAQNLTAPP
jgi:hypothetical protein